MRGRRFWLVLAVLLVPTAVAADDHRADLFGGFSFARASNLWGGHGSFAVALNSPPSNDVSVVLIDFSVHGGSHGRNDSDVTQVTFLSGLRYTFAWKERQNALPFVHVLAGGIHRGNDLRDDTDPALALGAGWEYVTRRTEKDRGGSWGIRIQGDYIVHAGDITPRISVGLLKRW